MVSPRLPLYISRISTNAVLMTIMQMRDLRNLAKAEVAKKGLGEMPKDGLIPRIYRKRPPIREVSNRLANENAQAAKDCAEEGDAQKGGIGALSNLEEWMRDMALAKPDDEF